MWSNSFFYAAFCALAATSSLVDAHSWIEQLMVLAPNGTMVGTAGFPRANVLRSNPSFSDTSMVNLIPPNGRTINQILATDPMCRASQQSQSQTAGSPRLQAVGGSFLSLRYQENGHVTLPQNQPGKPGNRGTVFVYGTTNPKTNENFLDVHRVWNAAGTGGDGRGVLLSTQSFDDGQCYQVNSGTISQQRQKEFPHQANSLMGADLWCQQDIALPSNLAAGKPYTLYWVWDWPTLPGTTGFPNGKQEIYTTCMDIDIVQSSALSGISKAAGNTNFANGQSLNSAAIRGEFNDITNPTAVVGSFIPFSSTAQSQASGSPGVFASAASGSSSSSSLPAPPQNAASPSTASTTQSPIAATPSSSSKTGQTATVKPIPALSSSNRGDISPTSSTSGPLVQPTTIAPNRPQASPQVTSGTSNGVGSSVASGRKVVTVTVIDAVTETVYTTIHRARPSKRSDAEDPVLNIPSSTCESVYQLKARNPFYPFHIGIPVATPSNS